MQILIDSSVASATQAEKEAIKNPNSAYFPPFDLTVF